MKLIVTALVACVVLVSCGADGAPLKPKYSTETTIGYNSRTGPFNTTSFGVAFSP